MNEVYADSGLGKWFGYRKKGGAGGGGWDRYNTKGERIGKCGDKSSGEGKPKCLSKDKARKMSKKERGNAVRRKRKSDPSTDRPGTGNKPINVSNRINKEHTMLSFRQFISEKNVPTDPSKWAASKAAAKAKFDVYPSAYANAWASKNYKSKGGGWRKSNESVDEDWQKANRQDKTDGMSQKAVNAYRRENPGSKLKTAVTEKKPTGKRASRRKAFCSRMKGMKSKLTSAETSRDPDSRINKALRRWNCN